MAFNNDAYHVQSLTYVVGLSSVIGVTASAYQVGVFLTGVGGTGYAGGSSLAVGGSYGFVVSTNAASNWWGDAFKGTFYLTAVGSTLTVQVLKTYSSGYL